MATGLPSSARTGRTGDLETARSSSPTVWNFSQEIGGDCHGESRAAAAFGPERSASSTELGRVSKFHPPMTIPSVRFVFDAYTITVSARQGSSRSSIAQMPSGDSRPRVLATAAISKRARCGSYFSSYLNSVPRQWFLPSYCICARELSQEQTNSAEAKDESSRRLWKISNRFAAIALSPSSTKLVSIKT